MNHVPMKHTHSRRIDLVVTVALVVLLALAACGGGGSAAPTAAPTVAPTVAPTEVVEAAPTDAPTEAPTEAATEAPAESPAATEEAVATAAPVEDASAGATETDSTASVFVPDSTAAAEGELLIDANNARGTISPDIYGANTGPLWVLMPAVWPQAEALGLNSIHFPGGEWGDQNDLTQKQIDDFVALTDRLGASPVISVRVPGGTPEKAAALVDYANNQMGYGIEYWAIGNEPNLYPPRHTDEPWAPQYFADRWREIAIAMKEVDPTIKVLGPEVTGYVGEYDDLPQWQLAPAAWVRAFLETNGDLVDVVSIHRYAFPNSGGTQPQSATVDELRTNPRELDSRVIPSLRALMVELAGREFPIAITEMGLDSRSIIRGETAPNAPLSALWWGDALMRLIDQQVDKVNYWNLATRDAQSGHGIFDQFRGRPVYYTFDLFNKLGDELLGSDVGNEDVNVVATLREDGNLALIVSNTSLEDETVTVAVNGFAPGETVQALRVLGTEPGSTELDESLVMGEELTLPPLSLTLFVVAPE